MEDSAVLSGTLSWEEPGRGRRDVTVPRPPSICSTVAVYMSHARRLYVPRPWKGHVLPPNYDNEAGGGVPQC